jgi:hypothetical protein
MNTPRRTPSGRYLEDTEPGDLVRVRLVAFEFVPFSCWDLRILVGDLLLHLDSSSEEMVLAHSDGRRFRIPRECARFIGVQRLARAREDDQKGDALDFPGVRPSALEG